VQDPDICALLIAAQREGKGDSAVVGDPATASSGSMLA
jgi:hypothetical protein